MCIARKMLCVCVHITKRSTSNHRLYRYSGSFSFHPHILINEYMPCVCVCTYLFIYGHGCSSVNHGEKKGFHPKKAILNVILLIKTESPGDVTSIEVWSLNLFRFFSLPLKDRCSIFQFCHDSYHSTRLYLSKYVFQKKIFKSIIS